MVSEIEEIMKYKVMKQWVKALRSGKYKQGTGLLNGPEGFCCLGVLCDISKRGKWLKDYYCGANAYLLKGETQIYGLPAKVMEWAGMEKTNGGEEFFRCEISHRQKNLIGLNDSGKSFKEIAKIIEKNYKKL